MGDSGKLGYQLYQGGGAQENPAKRLGWKELVVAFHRGEFRYIIFCPTDNSVPPESLEISPWKLGDNTQTVWDAIIQLPETEAFCLLNTGKSKFWVKWFPQKSHKACATTMNQGVYISGGCRGAYRHWKIQVQEQATVLDCNPFPNKEFCTKTSQKAISDILVSLFYSCQVALFICGQKFDCNSRIYRFLPEVFQKILFKAFNLADVDPKLKALA